MPNIAPERKPTKTRYRVVKYSCNKTPEADIKYNLKKTVEGGGKRAIDTIPDLDISSHKHTANTIKIYETVLSKTFTEPCPLMNTVFT